MLLLMAAALLAGTPNYYMREQLPQVPSVHEQTQPSVTPGAWSYGSWADSTACVGSSKNQLRSASCLAGGVVVAESRCTAAKGATSQSVACTPTGVWTYSEFAAVGPCVGGSRQELRNASCIDGGSAAPDSQCSGSKGATSRTAACTVTGAWAYGQWTDSTACVGTTKTQTRSVKCIDGGVEAPEGQCPTSVESLSRAQTCVPTGTWTYSAWANDPSSACVVSGSSATRRQIRNASCIDGGTAAPDSQCVGAQQALSQSVACTPVGAWEYSAWTNAAGAVCTNAGLGGSGSVAQTRTATCKVAGVAAPGQCADPQESLTQSGSCTPTGVLTYGPWVNNASGYGSSCTYDGNTSTRGQTRNPICTNGGQTVPINQCAEVPSTSQTIACTPDGKWDYTWVNSGACVASKQTQNATSAVCKIGSTQVAENLCGPKLTTQQIACTAAATSSTCATLTTGKGTSGTLTEVKSGTYSSASYPDAAKALCGAAGGNVTVCSTYIINNGGTAYYVASNSTDAGANHIATFPSGTSVTSIATGTCVPN